MAGKTFSFGVITLAVVLTGFQATAQKEFDLKQTNVIEKDQFYKFGEAGSSTGPELAIYLETQDYYDQNLRNFVVSELVGGFQKIEQKEKDCKDLSLLFEPELDSIIIFTSPAQDFISSSINCQNDSKITKIIQIPANLVPQSSFDLQSPSHSKFEFKMLTELCPEGNFDKNLMRCDYKFARKLSDSSLNTTYQGYRVNDTLSIPESVSKMKTETLSGTFFVYLIEELESYSSDFDCNTSKITVAQYEDLHNAVYDLFGAGSSLTIDHSWLDRLFEVVFISLCTSNPSDYSTTGLDFGRPAVLYLENYNRSHSSYPKVVSRTFDFIKGFIKMTMPQGPGTQSSPITFSSVGSSDSIKAVTEISFGSLTSDCTCSYCSSTTQLMSISTLYTSVGFQSQILAIQFYKAGTINTTSGDVTYLASPEDLVDTNCLNLSKSIAVTGTSSSSYNCVVDSNNYFSNCTVVTLNETSKVLTVLIENLGIFAPIQTCGTDSGYSAEFECCDSNCTCYYNTECDACDKGWKYENGKCANCRYNFEDGDAGCSQCSIGYDSKNQSEVNCDVCATGFKMDNETGYCDSCATGWKDDEYGNVCAECAVGFEDDGDTGTLCGKCSTGYKSSNSSTVTCDLCDEKYGKADDGSCGSCKDNCYCSKSGGCTSCITTYIILDYDSSDESKGYCVQGHAYPKSSDFISKYFDPNLAYISLKLSTKITVSTSDTDCGIYFSNSAILGNNSLCTVKNFRTLLISLGDDFTITPDVSLELSENFLVDTTDLKASPIALVVDYSKEPEITAVISGSSKVTLSCTGQDFIYSGSSSFGPLKKSFIYTWSVVNSALGVSLTALTSTNETVSLSVNSSTPTNFSIKLTVSNDLTSASATLTITFESTQQLTFSLDAGSSTEFKRSSEIVISRINTNLCSCSSALTNSWTIAPTVSSVNLDYSRLRIPSQTLSYDDYTITLYLTCGSLSGISAITISITYSDLVLILPKSDQKISTLYDLVLDGSKSYDPDGTLLTYEWTSNSSSIGTSSSITIPKEDFNALETYSVTFTISATGSRTASQTLSFAVVQENPLKVSVLGPSKKVSNSAQVVLRAAASKGSATGTIGYEWSQVSGKSAAFTFSSSTLWISPSVLLGGTAYTFQYKATLNDFSASATTYFSVNKGASCDSVSVSPTSAAKGSKITVAFSGCTDLDNSDYPLLYRLNIKRTNRYMLILTTYSSIVSGLTFPSGKSDVLVEVCDTFQDCWTDNSNSVTLSRYLRQSPNQDEDSYQELKEDYGIVYAIWYQLSSRVDEDFLDYLWNDFEDFVLAGDYLDRELADVVVYFTSSIQDEDLVSSRIERYITVLFENLRDGLSSEVLDQLEVIASRIVEIRDDETGRTLALMVLNKFMKNLKFEGIEYVKILSGFKVYIVEDLFENIKLINKLTIIFDLEESGFEKNDIVRVEVAGLVEEKSEYSFSFSAYSSLYTKNGEFFTYNPVKTLSTGNKGCQVLYKSKTSQNSKCFKLDSSTWMPAECSQTSLYIQSSGIYRIDSEANSSEESSTYQLGPELYTIISLLTILLFCIPFFKLIDSNGKIHPSAEKNSVSTAGGVSSRVQTDYDYEEIKPSIISYHLFLSIFISSPNISRTLRLLRFLNIIILQILMQVILFNFSHLNLYWIGALSACITLPMSLILILCFRNSLRGRKLKLAVALSVLMHIGCAVAVLFMNSAKNWVFSFLIGLSVEIIFAESVLMFMRASLKI